MSFEDDQFRDNVKARVDLASWITKDGIPLKGAGREFKACCPFHVEQTPSFTVFQKEGYWGFYCHGCHEGGDIFSWVMRRRGLDFPQALKLVANEVGMSQPDRLYQPREVRAATEPPKRSPFDPLKFATLAPGGPVANYLTTVRGIPHDVLTRYSVGQTADAAACAFAYKWHPKGAKFARFEFCKLVNLERVDGKKVEWREPKGGRNILFGMLAVPPDAKRLVIAEGEIDAMTWAHYGEPAVSVPGGAGFLGWIDVCWDWLARFTQIFVSFDEDRAGRQKLEEVVKRLGIARTEIVRLPEKPAAPGEEEEPRSDNDGAAL